MASSAALSPVLPYTRYAHARRVSLLALRLGQAIGLSTSALDHLRFAARVHDIGKIAVPEAILNKPGPLTPEEIDVVRQHVLIGTEIARALGAPHHVVLAIRHHHEWWDGRGYPDGLAGEAIPLLARVIAIVDACDAMAQDRPYRPRLQPEAALAELTRCAGAQFDPRLTEIFLTRVLADGSRWRSRRA